VRLVVKDVGIFRQWIASALFKLGTQITWLYWHDHVIMLGITIDT